MASESIENPVKKFPSIVPKCKVPLIFVDIVDARIVRSRFLKKGVCVKMARSPIMTKIISDEMPIHFNIRLKSFI